MMSSAAGLGLSVGMLMLNGALAQDFRSTMVYRTNNQYVAEDAR